MGLAVRVIIVFFSLIASYLAIACDDPTGILCSDNSNLRPIVEPGPVIPIAQLKETIEDVGLVPAGLGPNALPTIPLIDPVIGNQLWVAISVQGSDGNHGGDLAVAPHLDIFVPFNQVAALEMLTLPVEYYRTSDAIRTARGATQDRGTAPGDVYFGARAYLMAEGDNNPDIGVRFLTKSTTGKDVQDGRFINAPGYILDGTFGKTVYHGNPDDLVQKIRILAKLGFFAWQRETAAQDDAVDWGAGSTFYLKNGWIAELEIRGYTGWVSGDKPVVASASITKTGEHVDYVFTVDRGLDSDAPNWGVSLGIVFHIAAPKFPY